MFKHEIAYTDFNGNDRKEEFYFHLSLPEVTRLEAEIGKPIGEYAKDLADSQDMKRLLPFLEDIILNAHGKKTSDGKTFHKSKDIRSDFEYSQAYAELFEQLLTDPDLARKFAEGVTDDGKNRKNQVVPSVVSQ